MSEIINTTGRGKGITRNRIFDNKHGIMHRKNQRKGSIKNVNKINKD